MKEYDTLRVRATVASAEAENAEFVLAELGCNATMEEPSREAGCACITACFDAKAWGADQLSLRVREAFDAFDGLGGSRVEVARELIPDLGESYKQHFAPFEVAPGFVVAPSWEIYEAKPGEAVIELDPGMAFGTGLHETTRLCAWAIARIDPPPISLLDVGTGSGILAIAAHRMGVARICAVENDPDATQVARVNLERNGCQGVTLLPAISDAKDRFDVVVANILLGTLIDLSDEISQRVGRPGILILSGITHDQEAEIAKAYGKEFDDMEMTRRGEWSAAIFARSA